MEMKDLTADNKKEIAEYYYKEFVYLIKPLQHAFAKIIKEKDILALLFLIDIFNGLIKHAANKILDKKDQKVKDCVDKYVMGWKINEK